MEHRACGVQHGPASAPAHVPRTFTLPRLQVMRRYHIQDRDDYKKYNKLAGQITALTSVLKKLGPTDPTRIELTEKLLDKLHDMGVITTKKSLEQLDSLSTASFCRRRLPIVMVRLKMSETVKEAATFVEQGHVRVGPDTSELIGERLFGVGDGPRVRRGGGWTVLCNVAGGNTLDLPRRESLAAHSPLSTYSQSQTPPFS